jgi:hypothetical protein
VKDRRDFLGPKTAEVAHFDYLGFTLIKLGQSFERFV